MYMNECVAACKGEKAWAPCLEKFRRSSSRYPRLATCASAAPNKNRGHQSNGSSAGSKAKDRLFEASHENPMLLLFADTPDDR